MKVTRKQIGVKMKIDHETGYPTLEPIYETKIQPPMWRIVLKRNFPYYFYFLLCFVLALTQKQLGSPNLISFLYFVSGVYFIVSILFTISTIKENS